MSFRLGKTDQRSMNNEPFYSPWMTTEQAASYACCSARTLENLRREGGGPVYYRQGARCVVYNKDDLDAWRSQGRAANTTAERLAGVPLA